MIDSAYIGHDKSVDRRFATSNNTLLERVEFILFYRNVESDVDLYAVNMTEPRYVAYILLIKIIGFYSCIEDVESEIYGVGAVIDGAI